MPLHRLLVSGRLTQLRGADLAFTVAEAAERLAEYDYRPGLSDDDLAVLQARTEGWAAGLRLAAVVDAAPAGPAPLRHGSGR